MADKNGTLKWRVKQLEKTVGKLSGKIEVLMENHIPHLERRIDANTWKIGLIVGGVSIAGTKLIDVFF